VSFAVWKKYFSSIYSADMIHYKVMRYSNRGIVKKMDKLYLY